MKRFIISAALALAGWLLTSYDGHAQTMVDIVSASDSSYPYCPLPQQALFMVWGMANGYVIGTDSVTVTIHFGDGTVGQQKRPIGPNFNFGCWMYHTYTAAGNYTVMYVATGPDGMSDTLVVPNEVVAGDTCGNISGQVYVDANGNCTFESGDEPLWPHAVLLKLGGTEIAQTYTNSSGHYWFEAPAGNTYTIELPNVSSFGLQFDCPASGSHTVSSMPSLHNDFALSCKPGFDLYTTGSGWGFRPGFDAWLHIGVRNDYCEGKDGILTVELDPQTAYKSATLAPASVSGNTVTWDFTGVDLNHRFNVRIEVTVDVNAQIDDTLCFKASADPVSGDVDPSNNVTNYCYPVRNSWDPNMKAGTPGAIGLTGKVAPNQLLEYTVHFQNTGNDVAYNVYVIDTLDVNVQEQTMMVTDNSHALQLYMLAPNVVKFEFSNIMLPDSASNEPGSHGHVTYRIKQVQDLAHGTEIRNTAAIYFDFNPPIITNTVLNTVDTGQFTNAIKPVNPSPFDVLVHPNPAKGHLQIEMPGFDGKADVLIHDLMGRIVGQHVVSASGNRISVAGLSPGIYTVSVNGRSDRYRTTVVVNR